MSQLVNVKVNCPECGAENDFRMWESINTECEHAIPDIISHGLDDRVVELMKVCVDQHFSSTYNDEIIMQCFCHVEEDNFRFELVTEKNSYSVSIERNVYDELADAFREELQEYGDDDFVVDENWVDDFLDFCDREELDE